MKSLHKRASQLQFRATTCQFQKDSPRSPTHPAFFDIFLSFAPSQVLCIFSLQRPLYISNQVTLKTSISVSTRWRREDTIYSTFASNLLCTLHFHPQLIVMHRKQEMYSPEIADSEGKNSSCVSINLHLYFILEKTLPVPRLTEKRVLFIFWAKETNKSVKEVHLSVSCQCLLIQIIPRTRIVFTQLSESPPAQRIENSLGTRSTG